MENKTITLEKEVSSLGQQTFIDEWKKRREKEVEWFEEWTNTEEYKKNIDDLKKQNAEKGLSA